MIHEMLPLELWDIIAVMLNRDIKVCEDSIALKLKHPIRYEILFNKDGTIQDIRECLVM